MGTVGLRRLKEIQMQRYGRSYGGARLLALFMFPGAIAVLSCDGDSSSNVTLENVCDILPKRYCEQDRPCCEKAGRPFEETACEELYRSTCAAGVAAVAGHRAVFHSEKLDECVTAYQPYTDKCRLSPADFVKTQSLVACTQIFQGTVPIGDSCDDSSECAPKASPEGVYCAGTCSAVRFAGEGESCEVDSCNVALVCDSSFHCIVDSAPHYAAPSCDFLPTGTSDGGSTPP